MHADTSHLLMSVSKSLVGHGGRCARRARQPRRRRGADPLRPALANSGYAGATVRHLLDMRSGIKFSEDYLDPLAEVRLIEQAIGWAPRTVPDLPSTMYDFLLTLQQKSPHGGPFEYRSCETDVLGWVCEAASGVRMPELMSQLLWARLGARRRRDDRRRLGGHRHVRRRHQRLPARSGPVRFAVPATAACR